MRRIILLIATIIVAVGSFGCRASWKQETISLQNRKLWKNYLKYKVAEPSQPINTTTTHISNVSHDIAVNKINQALQNYTVAMDYKLSTVFQLATQDVQEGERKTESSNGPNRESSRERSTRPRAEPAVTAMSVQGHLYYVGFLDFPNSSDSYAMFQQVGGIIPAIAVVDGEDETKPAWIRTSDEQGNPYRITIHFTEQTTGWTDDNNIYRHLRNRNYTTFVGCNGIDNPKLELDDSWRPYFVVTYNINDACGVNGDMEHPDKLIVVDAQGGDLKAFQLDDPRTAENERDPAINKDYGWIDQIYSNKIVRQWIDAWGYNLNNYQRTSTLDQFHMDGVHVDEVMNYENTNIEFVSYIVGAYADDSLIGIMCVDPREGTGIFYDTQGTKAMATKSLALHIISETINPLVIENGIEFEVENLTVHTIYGEPTWQGQLTKPAYDNNGNRYGSMYYGTVLLRADDDIISENVAWAESRHEAFTKYQKILFLKQSDRIGSNVLEEKEIEGQVVSIKTVVTGGETTYLIKISGSDHQWEIPIDYVGDPLTEDVIDAGVGDTVYMKYADVHNRKTHLTREFRDLSKGQNSATHQQPTTANK